MTVKEFERLGQSKHEKNVISIPIIVVVGKHYHNNRTIIRIENGFTNEVTKLQIHRKGPIKIAHLLIVSIYGAL
jgi:hypothetical protein